MKHNKTAILVFAQSAFKEAINKPFHNSEKLFTQLNAHTLTTVKKTQLPYFHLSEKEQRGNTFGQRLRHAIQYVYDQGYDNVITIGNDTPHLQANDIRKTAQLLEEHSLILGPSKDGGFYLMGIHHSQFDPTTFEQLPWQTNGLAQQFITNISTTTTCDKKAQVLLLDTLSDIDVVYDAEAILKEGLFLTYTLRKILETLVYKIKTGLTTLQTYIHTFLFKLHFNKGSPLVRYS